MSLLNQVLQDLEKRKADTVTEQQGLNHLTAPASKHKKSYLLMALILIILLISVIFLNFKQSKKHTIKASPEKIQIATSPKTQKPITAALITANKNTQLKPIVLPEKAALKAAPTKEAKNNKSKAIKKQDTVSTTVKITPLKPIEQPIEKAEINTAKAIHKKEAIAPLVIETTKTVKQAIGKKTIAQKQKPLNLDQLAEQSFISAQKLQDLASRQVKLQQVLKLNVKHIDARLLLANTLLQQGLTQQSAHLLDQGLKLFPKNPDFIKLRSQMFLQFKQAIAALQLLQRIKPGKTQDEDYLALLAAAYQQNNQPLESLTLYQKLLALNPEKAEYWLGLAMAQEKQGNKYQALLSYQQALNKKTLQNVVVSYINQRISSLK